MKFTNQRIQYQGNSFKKRYFQATYHAFYDSAPGRWLVLALLTLGLFNSPENSLHHLTRATSGGAGPLTTRRPL